MLPYFADPYPDELLYSACARYHRWTGNPSLRNTLTELFGDDTAIPSLYFGAALCTLCENIGGVYTPEEFIFKHTLLPIYLPFLPRRRAEELKTQMITSAGNGLITKIGAAAGAICQKTGIVYCQNCIAKDREMYGEAYIHRLHQVQGVSICPEHGCILQQIKSINEASRLEYLDIERLRLEGNMVCLPDRELHETMQMIAKSAGYLLSNNLSFADKETVTLRYKQLLYQKGLLTDTGGVLQAKYISELKSFYGDLILHYFESEINSNDEYTWPKVAVRNVKRTVHPLRHILLIHFLDKNIETFFDGIRDGNIFVVKRKKEPRPRNDSLLEEYKCNIISIIRNNPKVSRTRLRSMFKKEYIYIYRRDRTWLMENLPDNLKSQGRTEIVDWHKRDISYCRKLQKAYEACLADGKRITSTRLIRRAGIQSNMENRKDKLPQSWAYVKSKSQTIEEYQIERCIQVIRKYIKKQIPLKRWQMLRMAGLTEERFCKIKERLRQRLLEERLVDAIEWEVG